MTLHVHVLRGCAPAPLAHYLKALGILRVVAEQADLSARGAWRDEAWVLLSALDREALEAFFLERYQPTPLLSPWNKGSGFYQDNDKGLAPLEASIAPRFRAFREGIAAARALLEEISAADAAVRAIKDESKAIKNAAERERLRNDPAYRRRLAEAERRFKSLKAGLIPDCRRLWRGPHLEWLDAALILDEGGEALFPALLGTGGNDGRLDFTNNFMQRLADLFDLAHPAAPARPGVARLLSSALWGEPGQDLLRGAAIGQYLPGGAGGANSTNGPSGDSLLNPWDFVLMMEGTLLFTARATRRLTSTEGVQASAPFALRGHAIGYAGASAQEESARGEQWMPLWARPMTFDEVKHLLAEGRAQVGTRPAQRPLDAARAISRLGVARGLTGFQRYGYLVRNGQSNLAVPLGRIAVRAHRRAQLVDDLAPWLDKLHRAARGRDATARLQVAERTLADAVFAALTHEDQPARWQAVLRSAAALEALQAAGTGISAGPIPRLSPEWVVAADDGTPTFRLAMSLAGAADIRAENGVTRRVDPVRLHWLPLDPTGQGFQLADKRLRPDPRVVCHGRDAVNDCLELVQRRLLEAARRGQRMLPLRAARGTAATPADLASLLAGAVDLETTVQLARALMAIDWRRWSTAPYSLSRPEQAAAPDDAWVALRLCLLPWPLTPDRPVPADPVIPRRLAAGDAAEAILVALRRLKSLGFVPTLAAGATDPASARLWGAALAFPISPRTALRLARQLDPTSAEESVHVL